MIKILDENSDFTFLVKDPSFLTSFDFFNVVKEFVGVDYDEYLRLEKEEKDKFVEILKTAFKEEFSLISDLETTIKDICDNLNLKYCIVAVGHIEEYSIITNIPKYKGLQEILIEIHPDASYGKGEEYYIDLINSINDPFINSKFEEFKNFSEEEKKIIEDKQPGGFVFEEKPPAIHHWLTKVYESEEYNFLNLSDIYFERYENS